MIHFLLIFIGKILFDIIPGMSQETSWTLVNLSYMAGSYLMFHYVRGVPFDFNSGAYDNLNMWEQIDNGDQYTPAKKFLLFVPIALFLVSTHYTHYDSTYFIVNCLATIAVVIPKLPSVCPFFSTKNNQALLTSPATPITSFLFQLPSGRLIAAPSLQICIRSVGFVSCISNHIIRIGADRLSCIIGGRAFGPYFCKSMALRYKKEQSRSHVLYMQRLIIQA